MQQIKRMFPKITILVYGYVIIVLNRVSTMFSMRLFIMEV